MRDKLLKFFPYLQNSNELLETDIEIIENGTQKEKIELHNRIFNTDITYCECPDIWKQVNERLEVKLIYTNGKDN